MNRKIYQCKNCNWKTDVACDYPQSCFDRSIEVHNDHLCKNRENLKLIFLDVDGVLNRLGSVEEGRTTERIGPFIGLEKELVDNIKYVRNITGADFVLSSHWRNWVDGVQHLKDNGLFFHGMTGRNTRGRGDEIEDYLLELPRKPISYVIVDDDSYDIHDTQPLVKTDYRHGLTKEKAEEIIIMLSE